MNGQRVLEPVEALSSPSHINATKGSSIWLHWNYTYIGDGTHNGTTTFFNDQVVHVDMISPRRSYTIARKVRQHGSLTITSPVPLQFTGRVRVVSSNNTLVISNLQYTDSNYQFLSRTFVHVGRILSMAFDLRPIVSITVYGKNITFWL